MISIGADTCFSEFWYSRRFITRFEFERSFDDGEKFFRIPYPAEKSEDWVKLKEVHVVCTDGLDLWAMVGSGFHGCSAYGNILLIDQKTGETTTPADLEAKWDPRRDELMALYYRKRGDRINLDTNVPFVPWLPPGWLEGEEFVGSTWYESGEEPWVVWDDAYRAAHPWQFEDSEAEYSSSGD